MDELTIDEPIRDEPAWMPALQAPESLWNMPAFLEEYTLHDSYLIEVKITPNVGVIVLIGWDLHWNPSVPREYDTLAIQFKMPYLVNWNQGAWVQSTLDGATSGRVTNSEREKMLAENALDLSGSDHEIQPSMFDETLTRTILQGMNGSTAEVLHSENIAVLCFDSTGNTRYLPHQTESQQIPD